MLTTLYTAVTQQMDNVALSCLLAMANVAVSYCRDGLCRSGLWARWILTAILVLHIPRHIYHIHNSKFDSIQQSRTVRFIMKVESDLRYFYWLNNAPAIAFLFFICWLQWSSSLRFFSSFLKKKLSRMSWAVSLTQRLHFTRRALLIYTLTQLHPKLIWAIYLYMYSSTRNSVLIIISITH